MSRLNLNPENNIKVVKDACHQVYPLNPVLCNLSICQAILESDLRETPSKLAYEYCNLFGIKVGTSIPKGTNGVIMLPTHEYVNGAVREVLQPFLWNNNIEDSFLQHQRLLNSPRYENLKACTAFEQAAYLIKADGYCTDPHYPMELISIYRKYIQNTPQ